MKSSNGFWAKYREKSGVIDLQEVFDPYWNSSEHEFIVPSQSSHQLGPLVSDMGIQRSLISESIISLCYFNSLQTIQFVSLQFLILPD